MTRTARIRTLSLAALAVMTLVASGCSSAPWIGPDESSSPSPSATAAQPIPNDLSTGSTQRSLTAGPLTITIDYWSTLLMDDWQANALKPVSLNLEADVTPNDGKGVFVQRVAMVATPMAGTEALTPLEPQVDSATVSPGYLALTPYSYAQTFGIGPVPAETTHVMLLFTYDLLIQTTPTSTEYAKQSATDILTVAIAQ